jgi:adenylate cyclase
MRQELLAPANAIMSDADILVEQASKLDLSEMAPDLKRIASCGRGLYDLIDSSLDVHAIISERSDDDLSDMLSALRHDLRNLLNAIKGYSEFLLEDLEDIAGEPMGRDLDVLLRKADTLLSQIDMIVDISSGKGAAASDGADADTSSMVADLMLTLQPQRVESRPRAHGHILVVDDNESNRTLIVRRLVRDGHTVTEATGGQDALDLLETVDVDLILLDLLMPDVNGYQVLEHIKSCKRLRDIPVIMVSGLTDIEGVVRCIEAGADDYLPKPINPVLLDVRINASRERKRWRDQEQKYLAQLETEKAKSEALLLNILPAQIINRLNAGETVIADRFEETTILFADLVGFTNISSMISPAKLVKYLNDLFCQFDALTQTLGVEKIKTIGDAYMAAAGLPEPRPDHAAAAAELAFAMCAQVVELRERSNMPWQIRIGLHSGPVVAGIIGKHKFVYDVWGDTVNQASRYESTSEPGRIHISKSVANALAASHDIESQGSIQLRGKGTVESYLLVGPKAAS